MNDIERQVLAAYKAMNRDIPDSDLDDEQPLTISVRTTLGEIRRIQRLSFSGVMGGIHVEGD